MKKTLIALVLLMASTISFAKTSTYDLTTIKFNDLYTIEVKINGYKRILLVDTGASRTVFFPQVTDGAMIRHDVPIAGIGSNIAGALFKFKFEVGSKSFEDNIIVLNDTLSERFKTHIDGILGQDVLSSFSRITIDYKNKKLILED